MIGKLSVQYNRKKGYYMTNYINVMELGGIYVKGWVLTKPF